MDHVNILNSLFSKLTKKDYKTDENEHAKLLLQSLPYSYDHLLNYPTKL